MLLYGREAVPAGATRSRAAAPSEGARATAAACAAAVARVQGAADAFPLRQRSRSTWCAAATEGTVRLCVSAPCAPLTLLPSLPPSPSPTVSAATLIRPLQGSACAAEAASARGPPCTARRHAGQCTECARRVCRARKAPVDLARAIQSSLRCASCWPASVLSHVYSLTVHLQACWRTGT